MRGFAILVAVLAASPRPAIAHGDIAQSTGVALQRGSTERIVLSTNIGLMVSVDGGASFRWVCSDAIGYIGDHHPIYAISRQGVIYATTFDGLRVSRDDGCTWEPAAAPLGPGISANRVAIGPDDRIWVTTANGAAPNDVYVSVDGTSFQSVGLVEENGGWQSVLPGPGDRVYVAGYRRAIGDQPATPLIARSNDGGGTWEWLATDGFDPVDGLTNLHLLGGSPDDPDLLFVRVIAANPPLGDAVYRSIDGGLEWERVLDTAAPVTAFAVRSDGETVIVGTTDACAGETSDAGPADKGCVRISRDRGASFQRAASEPRMGCLAEGSDGTLFACGDNWDPDRFALGSSSDGETWSKVYRFVETEGALECPDGTVQADRCERALWPPLCEDLGICPVPQGRPDAGDERIVEDGGCGCSSGGSPGSFGLLLILASLVHVRRRHSAIRDSAGDSQRRISLAALPDRR